MVRETETAEVAKLAAENGINSTSLRWIYLVMPGDWEKGKGHLVRLVFENTPGYCLSGGGGKEPWYWGDSNDEELSLMLAEETALSHNLRRGLTPLDIQRILLSSMYAK